MNIGDKIKKAREAKGLSQKEVAAILKMNQSQYSKIENNKVDPQYSTLEKVAHALNIELTEMLAANEIFKDISIFDKSLVEKLQMVEMLDETEKKGIFSIIEGLVTKRKLKDNLSNMLQLTH